MMSSTMGKVGSSSSGPSGSRFDGTGCDLGIWKLLSLPRALDVDWNCMATRSGGVRQVLLLPHRERGAARGAACGTKARVSRHSMAPMSSDATRDILHAMASKKRERRTSWSEGRPARLTAVEKSDGSSHAQEGVPGESPRTRSGGCAYFWVQPAARVACPGLLPPGRACSANRRHVLAQLGSGARPPGPRSAGIARCRRPLLSCTCWRQSGGGGLLAALFPSGEAMCC
jgi:hypothetical protein